MKSLKEIFSDGQIYWPYVWAGYFGLFSQGLLDNSRGPYFPDIATQLHLNGTQASYFFVSASLVIFFGSHAASFLLKWMNSLNGLRIGLLIMSVGFALISLSHHLWDMVAYSSLFGFGFGMVAVFQNVLVQQGATTASQRRLFLGLHTVYAFASIVAPFFIAWMMDMHWSWRLGFQILSTAPVFACLATFYFVPSQKMVRLQAPLKPDFHQWLHLSYMGMAVGLYTAAELSISTRLAIFCRRADSMDAVMGATMVGYFFVCLFIGRLLSAIFDFGRIQNKTILLTCLSLSVILYLLGLFTSVWALVFCGLTMAPFFGVAMAHLTELFPRHSSTALAYAMASGSLTVVPMHYIVGLLTDTYGIRLALLTGPVILALCILMLLLHPMFFHPAAQRAEA